MKILITETFKSFVKDNFKKVKIDYPAFAQRISKKISNKIYLKDPIYKLKLYIGDLAYRMVMISANNRTVPLMIFQKKDKTVWENIIWTKELALLVSFYADKTNTDILQWKYDEY